MLRLAQPTDCAAILDIYAQYIHTPITFEYDLPSLHAYGMRMADITRTYPFLVWEEGGCVTGYAYAHAHMLRAAYQWNAELSVYIDQAQVCRGIGKKLYGALIGLLQLQGVHTVYAGVTLPNEKSERLHRSLGFTCLGVYHNTGYKCDRWHDVAWFEKQLAPHCSSPSPIIPVSQLAEDAVLSVLRHNG